MCKLEAAGEHFPPSGVSPCPDHEEPKESCPTLLIATQPYPLYRTRYTVTVIPLPVYRYQCTVGGGGDGVIVVVVLEKGRER